MTARDSSRYRTYAAIDAQQPRLPDLILTYNPVTGPSIGFAVKVCGDPRLLLLG